MIRPAYLEPRTDVPAIQDWSTGLILAETRWAARIGAPIAVVSGGVTVAMIVLLPATPGTIAAIVVVGLVVGAVLVVLAALAVPFAVQVAPWYREAVAGLRSASVWTPVPVTLLPWQPNQEVAGLAQLPGGIALVQFPMPHLDVIANIADTGTMWLAGGTTGVVAVGVPRVPVLSFAVFQPDRDKPDEPPQPWLRRTRDPTLHGTPALR